MRQRREHKRMNRRGVPQAADFSGRDEHSRNDRAAPAEGSSTAEPPALWRSENPQPRSRPAHSSTPAPLGAQQRPSGPRSALEAGFGLVEPKQQQQRRQPGSGQAPNWDSEQDQWAKENNMYTGGWAGVVVF